MMKRFFFLILMALMAVPVLAQNDNTKVNEEVFVLVEKSPTFPGGMDALPDYLRSTIKYPAKAKRKGIEGKVFVQFVVEKDGSVTNAKVLRGVSKELDKEALRAVMSMPKWTPGEQEGKPVRCMFTIPIVFKLQ